MWLAFSRKSPRHQKRAVATSLTSEQRQELSQMVKDMTRSAVRH